MKAAVFHGPRDIRVEEVDTPQLQQGDVLLRIKACGICGSDLHTYKYGLFPELGTPVNSGRVLGHEFSAEVAEVSGQVEGLNVGDRVTAVSFGAAAEYVRTPLSSLPRYSTFPLKSALRKRRRTSLLRLPFTPFVWPIRRMARRRW